MSLMETEFSDLDAAFSRWKSVEMIVRELRDDMNDMFLIGGVSEFTNKIKELEERVAFLEKQLQKPLYEKCGKI